MQLQLLDDMEVSFGKDAEFELPHYMTRLLPEEISDDSDPETIVIAAGADPEDGKITLITLGGKVMLFDARRFYIPEGQAVPTAGGKEIFLINSNGRWPGDVGGFYVSSKWMLEKSTTALTGAVIHVNYSHEDRDKPIT